MPDFISPVVTEEQKRRHEELFKKNHVLGPRNPNISFFMSSKTNTPQEPKIMGKPLVQEVLVRTPQSQQFNDSHDSSFMSDAQLTPLTHNDIANNPQTPFLREEYRKKQLSSNESFSPAIPTTTKKLIDFNTPNSKPLLSKSLLRASMTNRMLSDGSASSSNTSTDHIDISETPSHVNLPKGPSSILKKNRNFNYDRETSQRLLQCRPELSSAMNEKGELNPVKAMKKVVMSPKKDIIPSWKSLPKGTRFSSPLTDSIEGRSKRSFRSPYMRSSPRKTKAESTKDNDWMDDEDITKSSRKTKKPRKEEESKLKKFFASLIDPQLPYILSLYLQLLFNVVIVSILLYFVYTFISTVKADVESKVDSFASDTIQKIALCKREYERNLCHSGSRVPAAEAKCSEWERCMNLDPTTVGRAKIGAETFAEIINGFIKPISWKSMFFLLLITVGSLVITNAAFGTYRNYSGHPDEHIQKNGYPSQQGMPQTPGLPQTPHQTPYKSLQMNPQYTRYYTPRPLSPTSGALIRHRVKSTKKSRKPS